MKIRSALKAILGMAAILNAASVAAQEWPSRPIRLIVPYGAGGTSDIAARIVAERLAAQLKQNVVIDNRAGVAGSLGTAVVAKATPDGHTLLLTSLGPMAFAPAAAKSLSYDPIKDFAQIGMIGSIPLVLILKNESPMKSFGDLVSASRARAGSLNFGSSGPASPSHLMLERVKTRFSIDIAHIPFKSGSPASLAEVVAGRLDGSFDSLPALLHMIKAGRVRAVTVMSQQRHALLPSVPTIAEAGYPELTATSWFGLAAPAATPPGVVQRLNAELNRQLTQPAVTARLVDLAFATTPMSTDETSKFVVEEVERWRPVVQAANVSF
jgi:tripartite-type tricarboxylate transporter receptor subunit TctC